MSKNNLNIEPIHIIQFLLVIRKTSASCLPIGHSFIPYDILIHVLHSHFIDEPLTVKCLFSRLTFSEMGTRSHFNRLIKNGWIKLNVDCKDSRTRICSPSQKLLTQFTLISKSIKKSCNKIDDLI
jgi:hypothetical protein